MKLSIEKTFMYAPSARSAETRSGISGTKWCSDSCVGQPIERHGVAVAAALGQRDRPGRRRRERPLADATPGSRLPAPPGRVECVLLHTSYSQATILPAPSSAALRCVSIAGP